MRTTLLRRAQTQLLEIIAVMIILTIIVAVVLTTASYYSGTTQAQNDVARLSEQGREAAQILRARMELRCPATESATTLCVDLLRAQAVGDELRSSPGLRDTYFSLFGPATITIEPLHPPGPDITIYNGTPPNWTSQTTTQTPIKAYNATTETTHFATLTTTIYI